MKNAIPYSSIVGMEVIKKYPIIKSVNFLKETYCKFLFFKYFRLHKVKSSVDKLNTFKFIPPRLNFMMYGIKNVNIIRKTMAYFKSFLPKYS